MRGFVLAVTMMVLTFSGNLVWAAKYDIKQMTPQVQKALESRRDRFDELRALKSQRIVGENNQGYVEVLQSDSNAQALASAENTDRKVIYQTIADQNDLQGQIDVIEKVFAQVQRDKASAGDKIQDDNGKWREK